MYAGSSICEFFPCSSQPLGMHDVSHPSCWGDLPKGLLLVVTASRLDPGWAHHPTRACLTAPVHVVVVVDRRRLLSGKLLLDDVCLLSMAWHRL